MRKSFVIHKYTLHLETVRLKLKPCKESLVHKIVIAGTLQSLSSIFIGPLMICSTISTHILTPSSPYNLLLATGATELDKIHLLAHPSGPSNVIRDFSLKITLEKSMFMYFSVQCSFDLVRGGCLKDFFTYLNSESILRLLFFVNSSLFKDLSACFKITCFKTTCVHLLWISSWSRFLCALFSAYIFNRLLYRSMIFAKPLWYIYKMMFLSLSNFSIFCILPFTYFST